MAIEVDFSNPPPWVVHVVFFEKEMGRGATEKEIPVTWPFQSKRSAVAAYKAAVLSGQFTRVVRRATKKLPAITVTLASLWRLKHGADIHGKPRFWYEGQLQIEQAVQRDLEQQGVNKDAKA